MEDALSKERPVSVLLSAVRKETPDDEHCKWAPGPPEHAYC